MGGSGFGGLERVTQQKRRAAATIEASYHSTTMLTHILTASSGCLIPEEMGWIGVGNARGARRARGTSRACAVQRAAGGETPPSGLEEEEKPSALLNNGAASTCRGGVQVQWGVQGPEWGPIKKLLYNAREEKGG